MSTLAYSLPFEDYDWFSPLKELFNLLLSRLKVKETNEMTVSELEKFLKEQFQNLAREAIQAKMNMTGALEAETVVTGSNGVARPRKKLMERTVETIFGDVTFKRWGYSAETGSSLFPADGHLNLPPEKYTHEVRRLVSEDVTRSSYDETLEVLSRRSAVTVPKRQGLELVNRAATDFIDFYADQANTPKDSVVPAKSTSSLLILTTDGKGVVMRHDSLREATKKAAEKERHKLATEGELPKAKRKAVDTCASYLLTHQEYLQYDKYLARGLPIATGVIEGACRYLVKDRMDITGARWGLSGAEAVLRLRSLRASGDFDEYWSYHEKMEQERNHSSKYENGLPRLRDNTPEDACPKNRGKLRLVKG